MVSQKENPYGRGPKVGGGGLKCSGTRVSVGGGKMIKNMSCDLKVGVVINSRRVVLYKEVASKFVCLD